jgi:hypothetical protein
MPVAPTTHPAVRLLLDGATVAARTAPAAGLRSASVGAAAPAVD